MCQINQWWKKIIFVSRIVVYKKVVFIRKNLYISEKKMYNRNHPNQSLGWLWNTTRIHTWSPHPSKVYILWTVTSHWVKRLFFFFLVWKKGFWEFKNLIKLYIIANSLFKISNPYLINTILINDNCCCHPFNSIHIKHPNKKKTTPNLG